MIRKNEINNDSFFSSGFRVTGRQDYTHESVKDIISRGSLSELRKLSRDYFYRDGFYKRLVYHYATLLKYMGVLIPIPAIGKDLSTPFVNKKYFTAVNYLESLSLSEVFTRCTLRVMVDGAYYGIVKTLTSKELVLIDLPSEYCRSNYKDLYGNDIVEFNITYFNTIISAQERMEVLKVYPEIFMVYYNAHRRGETASEWLRIPSDVGVCFTLLEERPFLISAIPAILQYEDAMDIEKERDLGEIRKIIVQTIPHMNDGTLLFEPEEAAVMHEGAVGMLSNNKNVSVLTTYGDIEEISARNSTDNRDNSLDRMRQNIYAQAGASSEIFASSGSLAVDSSIKNDISLMMYLANQYSRFIGFALNALFSNSNVSFKYQILPISYHNETQYITDTFKLAQSGYSFILPALATGLTQSDLSNLKTLENDVLEFDTKLIPLLSAYTISSGSQEDRQGAVSGGNDEKKVKDDGTPGAPKKDDPTEKTTKNKEALDNQGGS